MLAFRLVIYNYTCMNCLMQPNCVQPQLQPNYWSCCMCTLYVGIRCSFALACRFMLGLAAIPAIVRFVAFFFLPESPRWLVGRGRKKAAQTVLERLRRGQPAEEVERELMEIEENLEQSAHENSQSMSHRHTVVALFCSITTCVCFVVKLNFHLSM